MLVKKWRYWSFPRRGAMVCMGVCETVKLKNTLLEYTVPVLVECSRRSRETSRQDKLPPSVDLQLETNLGGTHERACGGCNSLSRPLGYIANSKNSLGPYSRTMHRVLWGS